MKRIRPLPEPTDGLAEYLAEEAEEAKNWNRFRNHAASASYRELAEALVEIQHGLCGYCEIDIQDLDRQVEHIVPQSDPDRGADMALDCSNLIACCKGGTLKSAETERRFNPEGRNRSCGEAKENLVDANFIDPRDLPDLPSLTRVNFEGRIEADPDSCERLGVRASDVERTIEILGLNVERLRRAREERWNALSQNWNPEFRSQEEMMTAARAELLPSEQNRLNRFFTTSRSYFGDIGESVLSEPPRSWI